MPKSLTAATVHGLKWSYLANAVMAVLQIGLTAILARLLTPSDFGVVAAATVVLRFGQYFAQMGVGQAVVQKHELTRQDSRAGFTAAWLLGVAFSAAFALLAPLAADWFSNPEVTPLLQALSLTFLSTGLGVTALALLRRDMRFRALGLAEVAAYAGGYVGIGVPLALLGAGAWALVAAAIGQSLLLTVIAYTIVRHPLRPCMHASVYRGLFSFGSRVSLVGFVEYLCFNLDTIWAGRVLSAARLGQYTRGNTLVNVPVYYVSMSFMRVLMPSFARIQKELIRMRYVYLESLTVLLALAFPVFWGVAAGAREVVLVLLGGQWTASIGVVAIFALVAPLSMATHIAGVAHEATATLNTKLLIRGSQVVLLALLLVLLGGTGVLGIALASAGAEVWAHALYVMAAARLFKARPRAILATYGPGLVFGPIVAGLVFLVSQLGRRGGLSPLIVLLFEVLVGMTVLLIGVLRYHRGIVWRTVRSRVGNSVDTSSRTTLAYRCIDRLDRWSADRHETVG
jgi:lipopolysaccharide exporter